MELSRVDGSMDGTYLLQVQELGIVELGISAGICFKQFQLQPNTFVGRLAALVGLHCICVQKVTESREYRWHSIEACFFAIKTAPLIADCGEGHTLVLAQLRHFHRSPIVRLNSRMCTR